MGAAGQDMGPLVVVVGTGPTGLALAIELGTRGIPCLLLERDAQRGPAPRAKTTHVRTREFLRRWGIADKLAEASPFGIDYPSHIHFVTRLGGYSLVRFEHALNCAPVRDERYSEHAQWVPQYKLEAVLRAKAEALPSVEFRYGTEFIGYSQDSDAVRVQVRSVESGETSEIRASYLVGADGARSNTRDAIGAAMVGTYGLSRNYNIIFRAPGLAQAHPQGPGVMYWQINEDMPSIIGPMDQGDLWYFGPTGLPADVVLSDAEAVAMIKRSTGIDLNYEIISSDVWVASRLLADRYRDGRVFLAGDACHLHPPFGGFGMNMGVADAVDIGWKLAATLQGWGGPSLLDSYEAERRPVHEMVLDEAEANHSVLANQLLRDKLEDDDADGDAVRREVAGIVHKAKAQEFYALGIVLGLRYLNSPVIAHDGSEADWTVSRDYVPSAAPGSLAPHAWLEDGRSLYDLFGEGFTLLAFRVASDADIGALRATGESAGVPLTIEMVDDPRIAALYEAHYALIRPDQIVAWRGNSPPDADLLRGVSGGRKLVTDPMPV